MDARGAPFSLLDSSEANLVLIMVSFQQEVSHLSGVESRNANPSILRIVGRPKGPKIEKKSISLEIYNLA